MVVGHDNDNIFLNTFLLGWVGGQVTWDVTRGQQECDNGRPMMKTVANSCFNSCLPQSRSRLNIKMIYVLMLGPVDGSVWIYLVYL